VALRVLRDFRGELFSCRKIAASWLSEHLTAMAINFAATYPSFSILAGGSVFPSFKKPWTRTAILTAWMLGLANVSCVVGILRPNRLQSLHRRHGIARPRLRPDERPLRDPLPS